jgi:hypothetical protein
MFKDEMTKFEYLYKYLGMEGEEKIAERQYLWVIESSSSQKIRYEVMKIHSFELLYRKEALVEEVFRDPDLFINTIKIELTFIS